MNRRAPALTAVGGFGPAFTRWAASSKARLAVTGATGWMGRAAAEMAAAAGLTPASGRLRLFGSTARGAEVRGAPARIEALQGAEPLGAGDWLVLHFAFLGKEKTEDRDADAFMAQNDAILAAALDLAEDAQSARLAFASSGAVYGPDRMLVASLEQSPYGWAKVLHEQRVAEWAAARGVPLAIPRIFNIGGPCINKPDRYALSSLIGMAQAGGPIRIGATRPVFRSFVHVEELVAVIADAALTASPGAPATFDTCGREILEMGDLAAAIAARVSPDAPVLRDWSPEGTPDWYVGEARDYHLRATAALGSVAPFARILDDTLAALPAPERRPGGEGPH